MFGPLAALSGGRQVGDLNGRGRRRAEGAGQIFSC